MSPAPPTTLVVGASGILRPLAVLVALGGQRVVAVGRDAAGLSSLVDDVDARAPGRPGGVASVAADTATTDGARRVAAAGPFGRAVLYAPATTVATRAALVAATTGRVVVVVTSAAAAPPGDPAGRAPPPAVAGPAPGAGPPQPGVDAFDLRAVADRLRPRPGDGVVVLGWRMVGATAVWHTPEEIVPVVHAVLDGTADAVLGRVRPWADRPR